MPILKRQESIILGYDPQNEMLSVNCVAREVNNVFVYDMTGRLILSAAETGTMSSYSLRGIQPAVYITAVYFDDHTIYRGKFVKP